MQRMETMKLSGPWNSLGTHLSGGYMVIMYFQLYWLLDIKKKKQYFAENESFIVKFLPWGQMA